MDSHQDHKTAATSAGHEVHLCHRCGWPFPNPHPSSKHRRAHKKICGTVEGYKVIHSEEHGHGLSVSDDEHASDGDEHTPSPNLVKKKAEDFASGGGVGAKSNRSEDDVFSDAVTDFSDSSGISPISVEPLDKQKSLEVGETAVKPDITEQFNDPTMIDIIKSDAPTDIAVENIHESVIKGEEDKLACVALDSEEGKVSNPALIAVFKHETLDASATAKSSSAETVAETALVEETREFDDASLDVKESIVEDRNTSLAGVENAAEITFAPLDDQTTTKEFKKDVDHCEEKPNIIELLETRNENAEAADIDARNLQELSKTESSDNGLEKSFEVLQSSVISELPNNIHVTELKDNTEANEVLQPIVKEPPTSLFTDPKVQKEALPENQCSKSNETSLDVEVKHSSNAVTSDKLDDNKVEIVDGKLSIGRSDSLEGNCGSVSAVAETTNSQSLDTLLETNAEKHKTTSEADTFEPPSFMTLVQTDNHETIADKAGWFPSLTNVSNESEGRKKNEEIIAKVTNWSPVHHGSLKTLLNEVNSPKTKQVPDDDANQKNGTEKPHKEDKHGEEWDSPARYPIEIKKEKKKNKGKLFWVPFLCCSSAHRDL